MVEPERLQKETLAETKRLNEALVNSTYATAALTTAFKQASGEPTAQRQGGSARSGPGSGPNLPSAKPEDAGVDEFWKS